MKAAAGTVLATCTASIILNLDSTLSNDGDSGTGTCASNYNCNVTVNVTNRDTIASSHTPAAAYCCKVAVHVGEEASTACSTGSPRPGIRRENHAEQHCDMP